MTVIASSAATLNAGQTGSWFSPSKTAFFADIDTAGSVVIEVRRDASDMNPKTLAHTVGDGRGLINGPATVQVACLAGRQYRFTVVSGLSVSVAADE